MSKDTDYSTDDPDDADDLTAYKAWYKADNEKFKIWAYGPDGVSGAVEDFKFRDGDQWREEEKRDLIDQQRPVLVFNRTGVMVDAVVGSEIGNRREVRFIPREQSDAKPNEILTSAAEWFRDDCDAEDEESEAFKDTVTSGMGWTETRMDYESNPQGDPKIDHFDPLEARWDCNAVKANLVDSTRRWRVRKMPMADAKAMFPDADEADLNAAWADVDENDNEPTHNDPGHRYGGDGKEGSSGELPKDVTIVACQYFKRETYYKAIVMGPDGVPQQVELDADKYKVAVDAGALIKSVKLTRKVVVQCFLGRVMLKKPEPTQTGSWTWNCITGLKDHDKGTFYGIVRRAKDPQRWANKWLSQMMHILNSQAKGGIMAEKDAFENARDAEESWAKVDRITFMAKGALAGVNGAKWAQKPMAQFPAGFDRLLQYADDAIIKATGINMELLGMREVNQPGVLEAQRKQSGVAILASFFDSLRRYRKIQGRGMLHLIQNFLADGRLVRIVGEEQAQYVPLTKEAVSSLEYDIIVDDSPTSTNEKERTFGLLMQIMPMFKDMIGPQQAMLLAEYSPLPTSLVEKLKAMSGGDGPQLPPEVAQIIEVGKQKIAELEQENTELKTEQQADMAKIAATAEQSKNKLASDEQIKREQIASDERIARERLAMEQRVAALANGGVEVEAESGETVVKTPADIANESLMQGLNMLAQLIVQQGQGTNQALELLARTVAAPTELVRDEKGNAIGARKVMN